MNLYKDPWIPLQEGSRLSLKTLLCEPADIARQRQLALPRDDMELACLQLLISLVQVALPPSNRKSWIERMTRPLTEADYDSAVESLMDWFDLDHPKHPFMQIRGVSASDPTPIQKLLVGLPEGNNHTFFNMPGEARHLGSAAAAIALFNQASNSPSFGGGFKGGLRGTPITTLVAGNGLRDTIWRNVLHEEQLKVLLPWYEKTRSQPPVWVTPIKSKESIAASEIGLLRGLFWQPAHIELLPASEVCSCDLLGGEPEPGYSGFNKEKFVFDVTGLWPHPHSPREYDIKKEERNERFLAFTTTAPTWTWCSRFLFPDEDAKGKSGQTPAPVVSQWRVDKPNDVQVMNLLVGGYRNKKASILQRRHDLISIGEGWQDGQGRKDIEWAIGQALESKSLLRGRLYSVVKGNRDKNIKALGVNIHEVGEALFFQRSEDLVHNWLRTMTRRERREEKAIFINNLTSLCADIFQQVTEPYCRNPALVRTVALARRNLLAEFNKMKEGVAS